VSNAKVPAFAGAASRRQAKFKFLKSHAEFISASPKNQTLKSETLILK
jgi:hypothetical protein